MPGAKGKERQPRDVTINLRANQKRRALHGGLRLGAAALDERLKRRALANEETGGSRTYVGGADVCHAAARAAIGGVAGETVEVILGV